MRQPANGGTYFFIVRGPARPACHALVLPMGPIDLVRGSRANTPLIHRLQPLATTGRADRWCRGSYQVQVSLVRAGRPQRELATMRFQVR